jgi:putative ABC transport system permease protein
VRRLLNRLRIRARTLTDRNGVERELERELEFHLASQTEENRAAGMDPQTARAEALRAFGPAARIAEECRDTRRTRWIEHLVQDLSYASRTLRSSRTFTAAALATLVLGFGANTAVLMLLHGVLLQPLPFPDAERLVMLQEAIGDFTMRVTAPNYRDWRGRAQSFSEIGASTPTFVSLSGSGILEPERIEATRASASYYRALGVTPLVGRPLTDEDDRDGAERVALLSEGLWQHRFGADGRVIGTSIRLDGLPYTVVGVLPASVQLAEQPDHVYVPLALTTEESGANGRRFLNVVARLEQDVSIAAARHEMAAIMKSLERVRPGSNTRVSTRITPMAAALVGDVRLTLGLLWAAAALVLLIACANVANLHLSRNAARRKELALRVSLGATRGRIVRQLLAEHLALGVVGSLVGAAAATLLFDVLASMLPADLPRISQVRLDSTVLLLTLSLGVITSLVFGLVPTLQMSKPDLQESLKEGGRSLGVPSRFVFGSALVVGEIALSLMLLVGAGLLVRSILQLQHVSPGFDSRGIFTARLSLPGERYQTPESVVRFYDDLIRRLRAAPGVAHAAAISQLPLDGSGGNMVVQIEGRPRPREGDWENWPFFYNRGITAGYRAALGLRLLQGRDLTSADAGGPRRVALINETAARRYWPGQSPIGARFTPDDGDDRPVEIVGVIGDTRHLGLDQEPAPEFYLPIAQIPPFVWRITDRSLTIVLKTDAADPAALMPHVRTAARQLDADLPVYRMRTMQDVVADSTLASRNFTTVLSVFGVLALVLAAVGVYGLVAFLVQQRNHEFGVRIALGASTAAIRRLVLRRGLVLASAGVSVGCVGALAGTRLLESLLFQVSVTDPLVLGSVSSLLFTVAAVACWLPALRAGRVNPLLLLRSS